MYSVKRYGRRVACADKCLLVYNGRNYTCMLENISVSGALLCCADPFPIHMKPGEACGMLLCNDPKLCPSEYRSKVARHDAPEIALEFLEIQF